MNKKLLFLTSMLLIAYFSGFSQAFTSGNLAIYRYGNGSAALPNNTTVPVFIDEYTPAGVLVQTKSIPTTDNGSNFKLTGLGRTNTGIYANEGISTLSQDGKYLTIFGYNQTSGAAIPVASNGLVVGVLAADGSFNSTTTLSNDATNGLGDPRSAVIDGTNIWVNGSQNGIHYTTLGATTSTRISTAQSSSKSLTIGRTWASGVLQPSRLYVASAAASTDLPYATPLPTSSTTFTTSATFPAAITANQVAIVTINNRTLIYVADDVNNTIRRYFLNFSGGALGTYPTPISETATAFVKSLTAKTRVVGTNTLVDIFATTWGNNGSGTETSKLIKFTDSFETANPTNSTSNVLATTTTTLLTAPTNTLFKSISLVPTGSTTIGTVVLPVSLSKFSGKKMSDGVQLSWTTISEKNNSHFEITRSTTGNNFKVLGNASGNGNSDEVNNYSFIDKSPDAGNNYYQLKQYDFDGKSSLSNIIAVKYSLDENNFNVFVDKGNSTINILVNSLIATNGVIKINSLSGLELESQNVNIAKSQNAFNVPFSGQKGIYLVSIITSEGKFTRKIVL